jgi:recombination protein RecT
MKTDGSDQNMKGKELTPQQREIATLRGDLQKMTGEFSKALAKQIDPDRMSRIILTAVQTNPKLAECSRPSFFGAVMKSCQLALEPNTPLGQAFLIPRWNGAKKRMECNFQIGYQGIIDLCYRSGEYKRITADIIYDKDEFSFEYGFDAYIKHKPLGQTETPIYVYALYELKNGGREFKLWSWEKVMRHAEQFSESFDKGFSPWKSSNESREAMAKKTVLINLLKYAPKSAEIADAVNSDERVVTTKHINDGDVSFVALDIEDVIIPSETTVIEKETAVAQTGNGKGVEQEKETDSTDNGGGKPTMREQKTAGPPPQDRNGNAGAVSNGGNGRRDNSKLFNKDEETALQEMYERRQAEVAGPDFS